MFDQQPLEVLWDDAIPIDLELTNLINRCGLTPVPVPLHSLDLSSVPDTPFVLYVSIESFASLDALMVFVRAIGNKAFPVLRISPIKLDVGVEAIRLGIQEVICEGQDSLEKWVQVSRKARSQLLKSESYVFVDEISQHLLALIERVGGSEVAVLMNGPTGSGKEVLARLTHDFSPRRNGPFVPVNCAALPESLAESLLFGHAKGSFTGATKSTIGFFEQAEGGTLFLDEIGELPLQIQAKLLRAVQEKEITPVGNSEARPVNVRIVSATNRDLGRAIKQGTFREDLYFRISTFRINVPGLSERRDDILPLSNFFLAKYGDFVKERRLAPDATAKLLGYEWPGNVRELENVVQRAIVLSDGEFIEASHLFFDEVIEGPELFGSTAGGLQAYGSVEDHRHGGSNYELPSRPLRHTERNLQTAMDANEFRVIAETLRTCRTRKEAAEVLGISERTLRYKMARMKEKGVEIPKRKSA
jgi:two-component system response regulator FlrC